jgi:hypothetical protein
MTSNVEEMNNNNVEAGDDKVEEARIDHFIARFDKLLKTYEERMAEDMKLEIWNAHVRNEIIGIQKKDGNIFVGKSRFPMNINYTSVEQLKNLFYFDFKMANGVSFGYHIGGDYVDMFTSDIKQVFIMTSTEVKDANQYANMAPEFIKRLLPGY